MNESALKKLNEVIVNWQSKRVYPNEKKEVIAFENIPVQGEFTLYFENSMRSLYCNGKLMYINLVSKKPFITQTLSDEPLSENPMSDKIALEKILEEFDEKFYKMAEDELINCFEELTSPYPFFNSWQE